MNHLPHRCNLSSCSAEDSILSFFSGELLQLLSKARAAPSLLNQRKSRYMNVYVVPSVMS